MEPTREVQEQPLEAPLEGDATLPPEVQQVDQEMADATTQAVGQGAPTPQAPLEGKKVMQLTSALNEAKEALGGGELPPLEIPDLAGDLDRVPPELFAELVAARGALDAAQEAGVAAAAKYDFDPMEIASSDRGLEMGARQFVLMARDQELIAALQAGPTQPAMAVQQEPAPPAEPDVEGLV